MGNEYVTSSVPGASTAADSPDYVMVPRVKLDEIADEDQKHVYVAGFSDGYDEGQAQAAYSTDYVMVPRTLHGKMAPWQSIWSTLLDQVDSAHSKDDPA